MHASDLNYVIKLLKLDDSVYQPSKWEIFISSYHNFTLDLQF